MIESDEIISVKIDPENSLTEKEKKAIEGLKPRPLVIITAVIGLICYFLPWLKFTFFGLELYSIIGLDIPTTADMVGQWSVSLGGQSGGVSVLNLLYIIPIAFVAIIGLEIYAKSRQVALLGLLLTILMGLFIFGLLFNIGISSLLQLASIGLYGTLIASIVLVLSKNW